jgi:hypothetical protein
MSTSMSLFRRRGTVIARPLQSPRRWFTTAGDEMSADAGDWWVVDGGGRGRSIRDEEFRATHELVTGEVYRRTGVMSARRVEQSEVVDTLEGRAIAHRGMWVVTDASGQSWPVPDSEFRAGYEAVGPGDGATESDEASR